MWGRDMVIVLTGQESALWEIAMSSLERLLEETRATV